MFRYTTAIKKIRGLKNFVKGIQGGTSAGKTFGILPVLIDICAKNPLTETSIVAESFPHLRRGAMKDFKKIMHQTNRWVEKIGVYLDWNPVAPFWFHEELQNDADVDFLIINYLDNEACPESALNFILKAKEKSTTSKYWENWYNVYGLGLIGNLEGVIFENWNQIDTIPKDAKLVGRGMDFGYTNDPTTMVDVYQWNGEYIFDEVMYSTGLTNPEIFRTFKSKGLSNAIYTFADSAEPKSIQELRNMGMNIKGAEKGKDSIMFGIQKIQEIKFSVTSNSTNLIKEFRNYSWDVDKQGNKLNKPIDSFNHCIDAIRYYFSTKDKHSGKYIGTHA